MKCPKCGMEIDTKDLVTTELISCPQCGASLEVQADGSLIIETDFDREWGIFY